MTTNGFLFRRIRAYRLFPFVLIIMVTAASGSGREQVTTSYDDGSLKERFFITKDSTGREVMDSLFCAYHKNGKKKMELFYRNGSEQGQVRGWYKTGAPEFTCFYQEGKLHGTKSCWYKNGAIKSRGSWNNGAKDGPFESWYENGRYRLQGAFCADTQCGEFRRWYENGTLRSIVSFKKGALNGPVKWYHANGELAIVGYYDENGKRAFRWQLYHKNGEKCADVLYAGGIIEKKEYFAPDSVIESMFREIEEETARKK
ncbi:MAG: toxin-antitoxin system YwqK family antitoxin [Chitinispirillaceae bacterium]|nr:toxin-antitoxin system YwqK family antitoxin [Chitinispirillaceae bacterium]